MFVKHSFQTDFPLMRNLPYNKPAAATFSYWYHHRASDMKQTIFAIFSTILLAATSCIEDGFTTGSGDILAFSNDTLSFDTVFTGEATATKRFLVYNRHKKQLRIERIFLSGAPEGARFFLNVDGRSGDEFSNIEVRGEDSIFVFVEAHVDETNANLPFDVFDHLNFVTNGVQQTVVIRAAGQNAIKVNDWHITQNTTLSTDRPYRIMDSIVVENNAVLNIPAGTILYFHDKASLKVRGSLVAKGDAGHPVRFRGDRLDKVAGSIPFELMSGQWDGIRFEAGSFDNEMSHVVMQSSATGISVDSCGNLDRRKLHLHNSILHNSSGSVLKAAHAWIDAEGCEFSDAKNGVVDLTGGRHAFNNCTFANYYLFDAVTSPILTLGYVMPDEKIYENPLMEASFNNCVVYGNAGDISIGDLSGSSVMLRNCLLRSKGTDDANFISCIWGGDPKFYTVRDQYIFDYRLKNESDAIGKGDPSLCPDNARFDLYGNDRFSLGTLDLGAYVWIPQTDDNTESRKSPGK